MKSFNMSEWALSHRPFVLFVMIMLGVIGTFSYGKLGQSEDPPFTFKVMVVRTLWTGASAQETELQITQKLEKKLQEAPYVDVLRSYSKPGESQIIILLKDSTPAAEVPNAWYQVRKKVADMRHTLPTGISGPFFNDEFGDTLGNLFTLSGDGYSYAQLKSYADTARLELLRVPDVAKVDIIGDQEEKIFVELSNTKLATLGLDPNLIFTTLQAQNAMTAAGSYETASDKIFLRVSGDFETAENVRNIIIRAGNRSFRLGDIARVYRGYADPPQPKVRFMGKEAIELGVAMTKGGDIIQLGKNLDKEMKRILSTLPIGLDFQLISSQPRAVARSINEFIQTLAEAVIIVLIVSFFSLGLRTGIVVALSIPLVLAATFFFMNVLNIGLHKISLGALVLALGLLVDDAIIAVEMMAIKMEQGYDRVKAASFAYTSTAFPMLTGTLVTAAGFLPIATAQSATGEYTRAIFQVTVIALLISWFAAVIFIPYLGFKLLPDFQNKNIARAKLFERMANILRKTGFKNFASTLSRRGAVLAAEPAQHDEHAVYHTPFYTRFRKVVEWCVNYRKTVMLLTAAIFALSIFSFGNFVQQQFFPDSTRPELLVDLRLPEGSSFVATETEAKKLEKIIADDANIENYVSYIGTGSPRFYLPLDQQLPNVNFAQFVILAKGTKEREVLRNKLITLFETDFPHLRGNINRLENGPPVGFPVQFRVTGPDIPVVQKYAAEVAEIMRQNKHLTNVQLDWNEQSKSINIQIDQEKARLLGVSSQDLSFLLNNSLNGFNVTSFRERDKLIEVLVRGAPEERIYLSQIENLSIPTRVGKSVPLSQFAKVTFGFERGIVWRRNLYPSVNARGSIYGSIQAPVVTGQIEPLLEPIRKKLPEGYTLETGGAVEESAKGSKSIVAGVPLFIAVVLTVLMMQLHSFSRMFMVLLTAPLGIIGVTLALLIGNKPFGFVAMLGTIALSGMIMRNSVILVDQIEHDIGMGHPPWDAIIDATVRRFRPIVLTAAAAILAMIPLSRSAFFGPMATAIMGGLFVATLLTLLFLPALYAAWFRVKRPYTV